MPIFRLFLAGLCLLSPLCARLPEIKATDVNKIMGEVMEAHASQKSVSPEMIKRTLVNYIEELDPAKTYFIEEEISIWIQPSDELLKRIVAEYEDNNFTEFEKITDTFSRAIIRRHEIEEKIDLNHLPEHVSPKEFKDMKWATDANALLTRLTRLRALQMESISKLPEDLKKNAMQRIEKQRNKFEEEVLTTDPILKERFILTHVLKSSAGALDSHTAYFTPDEANQFMINVQQRLFGIGAQLRDDINGFTVVKIIEGGPAASSSLKTKDRIVAVNGEPLLGMDIVDAVELIRGEENTPVMLAIIREEEGEEKKLDITMKRGEVVLKETRYEVSYEPFADGVIAYLRLFSFYQDEESSSATDLAREFNKLRAEHNVKGVILDLRSNTGGMLSQAVAVSGLFITKGIVVSIKDDQGAIQHLRDIDGTTIWNGPLVVMINRTSASASEIVSKTLQDYGRAMIVGDDHSYGKGSFQTFTLNTGKNTVNPRGEYKVTRGRYYTVSGKTPQLTGVLSDVVIPGAYSEADVGEKFQKFPLENDSIKPNFDDDLSDVPFYEREKIRSLYRFNLQPRLHTYEPFIKLLQENANKRIENNKNYQTFLKELKKASTEDEIDLDEEEFGKNDLQLAEAYNITKDLIVLLSQTPPQSVGVK